MHLKPANAICQTGKRSFAQKMFDECKENDFGFEGLERL